VAFSLLPPPDAGDLMIKNATVAGTSDATYGLDNNGVQADADDLTLLKDVSVRGCGRAGVGGWGVVFFLLIPYL